METIWLEIDGNEMMARDLAVFLEFLSVQDMQYASYYGEDYKMVMEVRGVMTDTFNDNIANFIYYQPITQLDEEPDISDIDLIDEMSNID